MGMQYRKHDFTVHIDVHLQHTWPLCSQPHKWELRTTPIKSKMTASKTLVARSNFKRKPLWYKIQLAKLTMVQIAEKSLFLEDNCLI